MMETVFLLLGFSGEDPNFRKWLDWVAENLRESAPRIYWAGWLGLSEPRREELREKKVVPIDLARHPRAGSWPENLKHVKALEWVLLSPLEHGRPYSPEDWPSHVAPSRPTVPADLQPVQSVLARFPIEEPTDQAQGAATRGPVSGANQRGPTCLASQSGLLSILVGHAFRSGAGGPWIHGSLAATDPCCVAAPCGRRGAPRRPWRIGLAA